MKNLIFLLLSILIFIPIKLLGNDALCIFQNRIKKLDNFHAHFIQKIYNSEKVMTESNQGELWIKKPNLFHYHVFNPEEFFLISDGKTIWFYVPFINQVTAYCLNKNIANNMFLSLLFNNDLSKYKKYDITQKNNWFYLKPLVNNDLYLKECKIKIDENGIIDQFIIIESHEQYVDYKLSYLYTKSINLDKFSFVISKDMQLDDQR